MNNYQLTAPDLKVRADNALSSNTRLKGKYFIEKYSLSCLESGRLEEGFYYLCALVELELNVFNSQCYFVSQRVRDIDRAIKKSFPYKRDSLGTISRKTVKTIKKYKDSSRLDDKEFYDAMHSHFVALRDKGDLINPETMVLIVLLEINNDVNGLSKIYERICINLNAELQSILNENHRWYDEY